MQAQPQVAEAVEVFGNQELTLEPQVSRPLVAQPTPSLPSTVITPADLLRVAMDSGDKDIERLERLMAMDERYRDAQERERQRAAVLAFRRDFAAFRGENVIIPKTKDVDRGKAGSFVQAEYDRVCGMLSPALSRHGFGFRHDQKFGVCRRMFDGAESDVPWVWVTCYLEHRDGHSEKLELEGPPGDLTANTPVQNMQVTASYLKRQSLLAITGTATGGEDNEASMGGAKNKEGGKPEASAGAAEALLDAGRAASMEGMAKLTQWWGTLTPRQQKDMGRDFISMRKAARAADAGAAQ